MTYSPSRFDHDPEALAWARAKVQAEIERAEKFIEQATADGATESAAFWRRHAMHLYRAFIGGEGHPVARFDERLPALYARAVPAGQAPATDRAEDLAKHVTRAIFALKSPPPPGSEHYRSGWDDGLEAAIDAARDVVVRRAADETPGEAERTDEDPARIDRLRPEFTEHASVESIDVQIRRARRQQGLWERRVQKLTGLRQARVAQMEAGSWPEPAVGAQQPPETAGPERSRGARYLDAVLHRGPGYDLTPDAPTQQPKESRP